MKNGGKERQSLAHKNPAVRRCEAEPQSQWHREKEVTCGADEVRMKKRNMGRNVEDEKNDKYAPL